MDTGQSIIQSGFEVAPEEKAKILKARAEALAKEAESVEQDEAYSEVLEFLLAHEKYALELTHVREVHSLKDLTPLPGTPPFILGIINVRGQILSIVDLKKFFDLPEKGLTGLNRVIILNSDEMELGILADAIIGMRAIPMNAVQPSPPTLTGIRAEYLKGVTRDRVVFLDGEKILSDKNLLVDKEIEA